MKYIFLGLIISFIIIALLFIYCAIRIGDDD